VQVPILGIDSKVLHQTVMGIPFIKLSVGILEKNLKNRYIYLCVYIY